jgi:hypothetical protein
MKKGSDIHDFYHRMELALAGLRENQNVSLHNRLKILEFPDYLETQEIRLPRQRGTQQDFDRWAKFIAGPSVLLELLHHPAKKTL